MIYNLINKQGGGHRMARNTIQQQIICDTVKSMTTHPSPDEVYNIIHLKYPSIGRATVYRVLNKLSEKGEIRKVSIPGTADRFDFRTEEHMHMICKSCGKVFDADFEGSGELLENINRLLRDGAASDYMGFESEGANISFYGICAECQSKQ